MTIYRVNQYQWRRFAHCCEPVAYFTDHLTAERYARQCDAEARARGEEYGGSVYSHEVEEVVVDDPRTMPRAEGVGQGSAVHA